MSTGEVLYALERANVLLRKFDAEHPSLVSLDEGTEYRLTRKRIEAAGYTLVEHALYDDEGEYISRVLAIYPKKFAERG